MSTFSKVLIVIFTVLIAVSAIGTPDEPTNRALKQAVNLVKIWLDAQRDYEQIPGLSAAIVHDQDLLWSGAFGYADVGRKVPAKSDTIYSICSISKLFTSIAVMQQRDAGKLRLDDSVKQHLPWFKLKRTDPLAPEIKIEGLLTHSSGVPREADFPYWTGPGFIFPTRNQIMAQLANQETLYPADTYFQYSNLGMALAGEIVSHESGEPYDKYVQKNILEPMGLRSTTPEMPKEQRNKKLATGYSAIQRNGSRVPLTFFITQGIAPAAGYASTVEDLARFASWQFQVLDRKGNEAILKSNTLREMQRVHWVDSDFENSWGLGFEVWRDDNKTFVGHGGYCPGFRSNLLLNPEEKLAVVTMANAAGVDTSELAKTVFQIISLTLKSSAKECAEKSLKKSDDNLERYVGSYESGFAGEYAIFEWEDGLAALHLPTPNPIKDLEKFKKVGEHTFRRIIKNNDLGETIVFEIGKDGKVSKLIRYSNQYKKVR